MTEQQFIADIVNTNKTDYLTAIRVLLKQNDLKDNVFDIITLLFSYNLPETNQLNIISRFINDETFDISSYEDNY
jgi:hypothetical protein